MQELQENTRVATFPSMWLWLTFSTGLNKAIGSSIQHTGLILVSFSITYPTSTAGLKVQTNMNVFSKHDQLPPRDEHRTHGFNLAHCPA